jgi:GLPGLI family protein
MKKLALILSASMAMQFAEAQITEGKVIYEQKIDMHRRIPEDNAQMRSMIPPFRTTKFSLSFADNQSLYQVIEEEQDMSENNNSGMVIRMGGAQAVFYKNFNTSQLVEQRELGGKEYLVEDSIKNLTWKLIDETDKVLGYTVKKATGKTERGNDVEAWFTEELPISAGPEGFSGLPGLILKVDVNKGEFVYTATEFVKSVNKKDLKAPTKGKKINKTDFAKLQQELFGNNAGPMRVVTNR